MKWMLLILSLILSLSGGGRSEAVGEAPAQDTPCSVSDAPSSDQSPDYAPNRDICLTSAQGYSFTGNDSTNSVSVRNSNTGRRTSPQTKSTFRMVKSGKVVDNNLFHLFLTLSSPTLSGIHDPGRYLFSLCRLRL